MGSEETPRGEGLDSRGRPVCGYWDRYFGACVCGDPTNHAPGGKFSGAQNVKQSESPDTAPSLDLSPLERLRVLATAATPGPWAQDTEPVFAYHVRTGGTTSTVPTSGDPIADAALTEDAQFIAAANPATVRLLLDVAEAAQRLLGHHPPTDKTLTQAWTGEEIAAEVLRDALSRLEQ